jgi:hypothetical protein
MTLHLKKYESNPELKKLNIGMIFILIGILMQIYVMSFGRDEQSYMINPLIWFFGGILSSGFVMIYSFGSRSVQIESKPTRVFIFEILFIGVTLLMLAYLTSLFYQNPIDPTKSDVIPTIQTMAQRCMNFQYPYHRVEYPGWSFEPGYLPMQYIPFIKAELFKIDYRTLAYMAFVFTTFLFCFNHSKYRNNLEWIWNFTLICSPFLCIALIYLYDASVFIYSVELMDVAYYMLLAYSLFSKSVYLKAAAIVCCLLSRYGIVIWLPSYAFIYFREEGFQKTLKLSGLVIGLVLVLYVLPFMTKDPLLFFKGLKNYDQMAVSQWSDVPSWYSHVGKPYILSQGLGFAIYFLEFWDGEVIEKIKAIKLVHIIASLFVTTLTIVIYHFKRHKIKDVNLYLLGSLGLYLTVFYNFVFAPFSYLFLVPFFVLMTFLYKIPIYHYDK